MQFARVAYTLSFTLALVFVVLSGSALASSLCSLGWPSALFDGLTVCTSSIGWAMAMRLSMTYAVYHALLTLLTAGASGDHSVTLFKAFHRRWFFWKNLILAGGAFGSMFIGNTFFSSSYVYISYVGSAVFLVCQMVLLLLLAYRLTIAVSSAKVPALNILYLAVSFGLYGFGLFLKVMNIVWHHSEDTRSVVVCGVSMALDILALVLSLTSGSGAALPPGVWAAVTGVYISQGVYSAVGAAPWAWWLPTLSWTISILLVVTVFLVCMSEMSFDPLFDAGECDLDEMEGLDSEDDDDEDSDTVSYHYFMYHLVMTVASLFMPFSVSGSGTGATQTWDFWVMCGGALLTGLLFSWTLSAPRLFPHRTFGQKSLY
ncbi:serine incorporator/TMS membrane protein [Kipferlia bialata]|uniref:Serine incorporator/TMS membrane protein n=1 Tax=Kipferlia bialata TaxID=797122 RepID=A0A9K3CTB4_9EUKA|nr:serine incorporator/TMS membrane protein [Kipferlia bialata]|eukprot:g3148.t1